jgi:hypothetical protein
LRSDPVAQPQAEALANGQDAQGLAFQVTEARRPARIIKSYSDNFAAGRRRPWTH